MRPNQEVGDHPLPGAAGPSVLAPGRSRPGRSRAAKRLTRYGDRVQRLVRAIRRLECGDNLRPDNLACDQRPLGEAGTQDGE